MGISTQNKSELTSNVLKEFLGIIQDYGKLLQNPDQLKKTISDSIQLSEDEKKKVIDAHAVIEQAKGVQDDLARREAVVRSQLLEATNASNDAKTTVRTNNEILSRIQDASKVHDQRESAVSEREKVTNQKGSDLADVEKRLLDKEKDLFIREKDISGREDNLRQRAERLRKETEGL